MTLLALASLASAAPAVVERWETTLTLQGSQLEARTRWRVRIEDPAACQGGLPAPPELEGARSERASILGGLLLLPLDQAPGSIVEFTGSSRVTTWDRSIAWSSLGQLPVEEATVRLKTTSGAWSFWMDDHAWPERMAAQEITLRWTDLPAQQVAQVVATTWGDWWQAGEALQTLASARYGTREELGRELAEGLVAVDPNSLADRVLSRLPLDPTLPRGFPAARPVATVVRSARASPEERALVLANLLDLAGHGGRVGLFAPGLSTLPLALPAPAMMSAPAVSYRRDGQRVWLDPGQASSAAEARWPQGAAWDPGDLPYFTSPSPENTTLRVLTQLRPQADGLGAWSATVDADSALAQRLRAELLPLLPADRTALLTRLVQESRPTLAKVRVTLDQLERADRPLELSIQAEEPGLFRQVGSSLEAEFGSLLGPALLRLLDGRVTIEERISLVPPQDLQVLALRPPPVLVVPGLVYASARATDGRWSTWVHRAAPLPELGGWPPRSSQAAADARRALVLLTPRPEAGLAKATRSWPLSAPERLAREILILSAAGDPQGARKAFERAERQHPTSTLAAGLLAWPEAGVLTVLAEAADRISDPPTALAAARALRAEAPAVAWKLAARAAGSPSPDVSWQAGLLAATLQPATAPSSVEDPEGAARWRTPATWAKDLAALAPGEPAVQLLGIRQAISEGRWADAEVALAELEGPDARLLEARLAAVAGLPPAEVRRLALAALQHGTPEVSLLEEVAQSLVGPSDRPLLALLLHLCALLQEEDAGRWERAARAQLQAGDLPSARLSAERAAQLDPARAALAAELAVLAGDEAGLRRLRDAFGIASPPPFDDLVARLPPEEALPVLVAREDLVVNDPDRLERRANLRLGAGDYDGATRDGRLLERLHGRPAGAQVAERAGQARFYGPAAVAPTGAAELELALLAGDGRLPSRLAGRSEPLAARLREVFAASPTDWPEGAAPTPKVPAGFVPVLLPGRPAGVRAWADPDRGVTLLVTNGVSARLPPPYGSLWQLGEVPISRRADGVQVFALQGSNLPLVAGVTLWQGVEVWAISHRVGLSAGALAALRATAGP